MGRKFTTTQVDLGLDSKICTETADGTGKGYTTPEAIGEALGIPELKERVEAVEGSVVEPVTATGAEYELFHGDTGKHILKSHASPHRVIVFSQLEWVVGSVVMVTNVGPGVLTFENDGGTLLNDGVVLQVNQSAGIYYEASGVFRVI